MWVLPFTITAAFSQTATSPDATELDTLTVTAQALTSESYAPPETTLGALKTPAPLLETPQAVTVLTEQLIEDQDAVKLEEVLRNVAGISTGGFYGAYDQYRIRGFDASYKTYWDGLRGDNGTSPEIFGFEKVEVIKGPASSLYGNAPLGGLVNLVSKRPKYDTGGEIGLGVGSFNTYEASVDAYSPLYTPGSGSVGAKGGSVDGKSGIYGRILGLYRETDTFISHSEKERLFIAPSVLFQISEDTQFTFLGSYTHDDKTEGMPLPASGTVLSNPNGHIPLDRYIGIPGQGNNVDFKRLRLGYDFSHRFNDVVSVRQNFNYTRIDQAWDRLFYPQFGGTLTNGERELTLYPYSYDDTSNRYGVDTGLDFNFNTGAVKHTATVGVDYYHEKGSTRNSTFGVGSIVIDVFDPDYDQLVPKPDLGDKYETGSEIVGFYAQDHMKLSESVSLTLGGRFDSYRDLATDNSETAFSPKAGLTYEFIKDVAAYANYSKSFETQNDPLGAAIEPIEGENIEGGVKYSAFDGKWTGMASVFELTRSNALISTGGLTYVTSGEQRSRGFEFENTLALLPGLGIISAYTYLDAEVSKDPVLEGNDLVGVPENNFSIWAKYTIQDGAFKGVGFGLGGRAVSNQAADAANSFDLPSFAVLDAALYYEKDNFSAQVNFKNITDEEYFSGSSGAFYVLPAEPFNVTASASWKF
ncbi:TonB-dependent siderophore receptor [Luteolibacter yonseiensis]